jgi:hypothetical protein
MKKRKVGEAKRRMRKMIWRNGRVVKAKKARKGS